MNNSTTALRLMIVLAHADEARSLVDATLARYRAEGAEMTLVVTTRDQRSVVAASVCVRSSAWAIQMVNWTRLSPTKRSANGSATCVASNR